MPSTTPPASGRHLPRTSYSKHEPPTVRHGPGETSMSKLLLRNVFLGGIGVVAVSAGACAQGSSSPAKPAENPDASFVHKAGESDLAELQFSRLASARAASAKVREYALRIVQ